MDYQELADSVIIPAGSAAVKIKVKAIDNMIASGVRTVKIKLLPSATSSYFVGSGKAVIQILDND